MRAPASAERLIFWRRAETDHDRSMNAIACPSSAGAALFNRQMDDAHVAGLHLGNNHWQKIDRTGAIILVKNSIRLAKPMHDGIGRMRRNFDCGG